ncbi:MAG TPA: protein kinase [Gemmatimonadaceae bacterium]|nr:protein kinase [Gemmatimonadaceae bacterium]
MKLCTVCGATYDESNVFCPTDGSALRPAADDTDLLHSVIADRYLVLEKLGEGGMGRVYLAKHVRLPQRWAIKVLHPALVKDAAAVARFNQEASNAARIDNPHVSRVIDFGETQGGLLYLAMEYVEGEPLSALLERTGALEPRRAAGIVRQVAEALAAAHELGIVHRDLKPDNIMLGTAHGATDEVKVVDFGIAKVTQDDAQHVTQTGFVIGTPEYMSPEQILALPLDGRSDVYSLGLVAFGMLTGDLPFPASTPQERMFKRLGTAPRTLAETRPDVAWPRAVQTVLDRALAREPQDRYQLATDFARDLTRAIEAWQPAPAEAAIPAAPAGRSPAAAAAQPAAQPATAPRRAPRSRAGARIAMMAGIIVVLAVALAIVLLPGRGSRQEGVQKVASSAASDSTTGAPAGGALQQQPVPGADTLATSTASANSSTPPASRSGARAPTAPPDGNGTVADRSNASRTPTRQPRANAESDRAVEPTSAGPTSTPTPRQQEPPAAPAASATSENAAHARADLDRLQKLIDDLSESGARTVVGTLPTVLPELPTRADSVEASYYGVQANLILGDVPAACRFVHAAASDARQTRFAAQFQLFSDSLPCR